MGRSARQNKLHTVVRGPVEPNWGLWVNLGPKLQLKMTKQYSCHHAKIMHNLWHPKACKKCKCRPSGELSESSGHNTGHFYIPTAQKVLQENGDGPLNIVKQCHFSIISEKRANSITMGPKVRPSPNSPRTNITRGEALEAQVSIVLFLSPPTQHHHTSTPLLR